MATNDTANQAQVEEVERDRVQRIVNGGTVRRLREAYGIRQAQFAADCVISTPYLSNIEAGRKQPSPAVARRIADRLGVALDDISHIQQLPSTGSAA